VASATSAIFFSETQWGRMPQNFDQLLSEAHFSLRGLPFDRVVVSSGEFTTELPVETFMAIALPERVRYLLHGKLKFTLEGTEVDREVALNALRGLGASGKR
jgi:hypothetical protein